MPKEFFNQLFNLRNLLMFSEEKSDQTREIYVQ